MAKTYFVTGTDTGVGKTCLTVAMLSRAAAQGLSVVGLKPVAAGCEQRGGEWMNDDALQLMAASNRRLPYQQVNPVALPEAIAPHIAAVRAGRRLSLDRLQGMVRGALQPDVDLTLIEGAGGWRVPLGPQYTLADLAVRLQLPVILVVGVRLGCLNHALLTAEAIRRDGLPLAGWIANVIENDMPALEENIQTLRHCMAAPCLGVIPNLPSPLPAEMAPHLNLDRLNLS